MRDIRCNRKGGITNKNIPQPENRAKNENDVADLETDVEEEVVENQEPYYIDWVNDLKYGVDMDKRCISTYGPRVVIYNGAHMSPFSLLKVFLTFTYFENCMIPDTYQKYGYGASGINKQCHHEITLVIN